MLLLLFACAPPSDGPGLVLLDPDALDAGVTLQVDGRDDSSALPRAVWSDEEAWLEGPDGQVLELDPHPGELHEAWLEAGQLVVEILGVGQQVDGDQVFAEGSAAQVQELADAVGAELEVDPDGAWLTGEQLLLSLGEGWDLPEVQGVFTVEPELAEAYMLGAGALSEPSSNPTHAADAAAGAVGASGHTLGGRARSVDAHPDRLVVGAGALRAVGEDGVSADPRALLLLAGFYGSEEGQRLSVATDGTYVWTDGGHAVRGWLTMLGGEVHLYSGGHGPVASLIPGADGRLHHPDFVFLPLEDLLELP